MPTLDDRNLSLQSAEARQVGGGSPCRFQLPGEKIATNDDRNLPLTAAMDRLSKHAASPRIQSFIESNSIKIPESGCWIWMKSLTARGGYGQVSYGSYGTEKAHRLSYVAFHGFAGVAEKLVCHTCDCPSCVNPNHLFLGSYLDNHLDMVRKQRGNYARIAKEHRKLTSSQVREIRQSPLSQIKLADIYSVSVGTIGQARRKNQYRDVL